MSFAEKIYTTVIGLKTKRQRERERINFIRELLAIYDKRKIKEKDVNDFAKNIASEFFVDEIVGSKNGDAGVTINSEKRIQPQIVKQREVFENIKDRFPEASMVSIKNGDKYEIIYLDKDTLFNMRTTGDLSSLEAKKIVERLNEGIGKWQELSQ